MTSEADRLRRIVREEILDLRNIEEGGEDAVKLAIHLQSIDDTLTANTRELTKMADRVGTQNHRLDKLEAAHIKEQGRQEERERWEKRQADTLKWIFATGLAVAGLLSGMVFGALDYLLK